MIMPSLAERNNKLDEINEEIWKCDDCKVRSYYEEKGKYFRPEPFPDYSRESEYRMLYVAINPGWNRNNENNNNRELWTDVYACSDYATYVQKYNRAWKMIWMNRNGKKVTDTFSDNLAQMADAVKNTLCRDINETDCGKYVFRAQLSYCASQSPTKRNIFGETYKPDGGWGGIFGETRKKGDKGNVKPSEVNNCRKHLKRGIECVKPEVIIFFGQYSRDHFTSNNEYLYELLGKGAEGDDKFLQETFDLKGGKTGVMKARVTTDKKQKILFLPHPCARIKNIEDVTDKIKNLCNKLIQQG